MHVFLISEFHVASAWFHVLIRVSFARVDHIHCVVTTATEWVFVVVVNTEGDKPGTWSRSYYPSRVYDFTYGTSKVEQESLAETKVLISLFLLWVC